MGSIASGSMKVRASHRPRLRPGRFFLFTSFLCALSSSALHAQQPTVRPDTAARRATPDTAAARRAATDTTSARKDSLGVRADTGKVVPDSLRPVKRVPHLAYDSIGSWRAGRWVWDRDSLEYVGR